MKRGILISIVLVAIGWILYSSYELWINRENTIEPRFVFCELDNSVLLINKFEETKTANYFETIKENPLAILLENFEGLEFNGFKIYASGNRPILILEKNDIWQNQEIEEVKNRVKLNNVQFKSSAKHFMLFSDFPSCKNEIIADFLLDGDKKASANYWVQKENQWNRTDIYNLSQGFFEYRSSMPLAVYGKATDDISHFSGVIPISSSSYLFQERFYAEANDSIFKNSPMSKWVDEGFIMINYENHPVLISDYRSQQTPNLILLEQTKDEEFVEILDDMYSFIGFQLTEDFPISKNNRFYSFEIEDKAFFVESKEIARKILVDYQLGKTLALSPEKQNQFFSGLPSQVNTRNISADKKSSLTWKNQLLFEVNTMPPSEQLQENEKSTWSVSPQNGIHKIIPIVDHLRQGTSIFTYDKNGNYELFGPNGNRIWKGELSSPIEGKVQVIDVFDNDKKQLLFRTKRQIYLIDLNGRDVGGFPYTSDNDFSSDISDFVWNGTKRFLVGTEKGEIIMLNSAGQELNIAKNGKSPIDVTPYAFNVGGLRVWTKNKESQQFLGYLEKPTKAKQLGDLMKGESLKFNGKLITYFHAEGKVFSAETNLKTGKVETEKMIDEGQILTVNDEFIILSNNNDIKVINHNGTIVYNKKIPFNEIGNFVYLPESKICVVLDYLQNKIHAYNKLGEEIADFPKEGRNMIVSHYNSNNKTLYVYTAIDQSIICYKTKF